MRRILDACKNMLDLLWFLFAPVLFEAVLCIIFPFLLLGAICVAFTCSFLPVQKRVTWKKSLCGRWD